MKIDPSDCFDMEADVGTVKVMLSNGLVPITKFERKVYGVFINNRAGTANTLTLTIEKDTTVERTILITLEAYGTIDVNRPLDSPILSIRSGRNIKAVASSPSITVVLNAYDQ